MLRLLRKMRLREILMCLGCAACILGQVFFDLRLPEYMSSLTVLIQTPGSSMTAIWLNGLQMLGCVVCSAVLAISCGYLNSRTAAGFTYAIRSDMFRHVMNMGQQEILRFSVPSLITRTTNDVGQVQMAVSMGLQNLIKAPIMATWAIVKILDKSWELSLITAGFVVVMCGSVLCIMMTVFPRFRIVQKLTDSINRVARENLSGINVVHAFNAEDYQNNKFDETNTKMLKTQLFNQRVMSLMQPIMQFGMNSLSLTIYWVGAALLSGTALAARLTMFSDLVVFSTYATHVVMSFMMLVMIFMMLPAALVSAERINDVLDTKSAVKEGTKQSASEVGTVEFKNVSFYYPGAMEDELVNINFRVEKGQTVAIIGSTGSGKTTLINLIARFYDATKGEVLVDGVNVKDYTFSELYSRIAYVPQKAVLFSDSIAENVSFGEGVKPVGEREIVDAIELAQASEFVNKLEDGIDYRIAQAGRNLSGGQKQRLSIARALARGAEILIFDDSFSALDYRTDAVLRAGLNEKLGDTTRIIVAQRVGTIRHADKILVLEDGRIVGSGTHDELMKECHVYREIAKSQLSEAELA